MIKKEFKNELCAQLQNMGIPDAIVFQKFLHEIYPFPENGEYDVNKKEENGKVIYNVSCRDKQVKYDYVITLDNLHKEYTLDSNARTFENFKIKSNTNVRLVVKYGQAWNNELGFDISEERRESILNEQAHEFKEYSYNTRSLCDNNGIEMRIMQTNSEYIPIDTNKENILLGNDKFVLIPLNRRFVENKNEHFIDRMGLIKAIDYVSTTNKDGSIKKSNKYYLLDNEKGLSLMRWRFDDLTENDYHQIQEVFSSEELENLLSKDYGTTKEALKEKYGKSKSL